MITIVHYGMGTIRPIVNILKRIGVEARSTADSGDVSEATKLILFGVGAFGQAMHGLHESRLADAVNRRVHDRIRLLGICR